MAINQKEKYEFKFYMITPEHDRNQIKEIIDHINNIEKHKKYWNIWLYDYYKHDYENYTSNCFNVLINSKEMELIFKEININWFVIDIENREIIIIPDRHTSSDVRWKSAHEVPFQTAAHIIKNKYDEFHQKQFKEKNIVNVLINHNLFDTIENVKNLINIYSNSKDWRFIINFNPHNHYWMTIDFNKKIVEFKNRIQEHINVHDMKHLTILFKIYQQKNIQNTTTYFNDEFNNVQEDDNVQNHTITYLESKSIMNFYDKLFLLIYEFENNPDEWLVEITASGMNFLSPFHNLIDLINKPYISDENKITNYSLIRFLQFEKKYFAQHPGVFDVDVKNKKILIDVYKPSQPIINKLHGITDFNEFKNKLINKLID